MHANPATATSMNVCHVTMLKDKHKENKAKRNMNMEAERTPNWGKQPMQHDTEINGGEGRVVSRLRFALGFAGVARAGVWAFITVLGGARSRVRFISTVGMKDGWRTGMISG